MQAFRLQFSPCRGTLKNISFTFDFLLYFKPQSNSFFMGSNDLQMSIVLKVKILDVVVSACEIR